MSNPASTTKQSDLERIDRIGDLVLNFGWSIISPTPLLTDSHKKDLDALLDVVESQVSSKDPIPEIFWRMVRMNGNCLRLFRNDNDAKALAIVLMPHVDAMFEWIYERSHPSKAESIEWILSELQPEYSTLAGAVFTETLPGVGSTSIWFGRKADQLPTFVGPDAVEAARLVFGVEVKSVARPVSGREESATAKATQPKKEKPAAAKGARSRSETDRATEKPLIARPKASLEIIDIDCIQSDPENDRKTFDKTQLQELADSIKKHGVLQPILLRPLEGKNAFVIVAGERRWRAAKMAGLKEVPAQISDRDGLQASLARLDENLKRVDLSPIEKAQGLKRLMDAHGMTQKELGEAVGVQQGQISNMLRLLNLPESMQKKVADGVLAPTLVRCVLPFADVPAIMEGVLNCVEEHQKDKEELTLDRLESELEALIEKNSRSMHDRSKEVVEVWAKPSKEKNYFGHVTGEELKQLDVRKIKFRYGGERELAFNTQLFDELNKERLKERTAKHKALKAKQNAGRASSHKASEGKKPFNNEWSLERALVGSLTEPLADALERAKDKQMVRAVCLALMSCSEGNFADAFAGKSKRTVTDNQVPDLIRAFNVPVAELDQLLRKSIVAEVRRDLWMQLAEVLELGKALGVDLASAWKPTDEVRGCLTDYGRELLEDSAGEIPDFLRKYFGLKPAAKAKSKKTTAA